MAKKTDPQQPPKAQNPLILRANRLIDAFAKSDDERDFSQDNPRRTLQREGSLHRSQSFDLDALNFESDDDLVTIVDDDEEFLPETEELRDSGWIVKTVSQIKQELELLSRH